MRRILFAFALLCPVLASAQDAPPELIGVVPAPAFLKITIHAYQCSPDRYPSRADTKQFMGGTMIDAVVAADGTVKSVSVESTSGNADIDNAALACARDWKFHPALKDGQPVEGTAKAIATWLPPPSSQVIAVTLATTQRTAPPPPVNSPAAIGLPHRCPDRPRDTNNTDMPGTVVLTYAVDPDGTVTNMTIQDSSGDKIFDDYAVVCVSAWQFIPTKLNSVPIRTYQQTSLAWSSQP